MYRNFIVRSDACGCKVYINDLLTVQREDVTKAFDKIKKAKDGESFLIVADYVNNNVFCSLNVYNLSECTQDFLLHIHYEYLITVIKHEKEDFTLSVIASDKSIIRLANREKFKLDERINPVLRGYKESIYFDLGKETPFMQNFLFDILITRNKEEDKILVDIRKFNHFKQPQKHKVFGCTVFNASAKSQAEIVDEIYTFIKEHDFNVEWNAKF